MLYMQLAGAVSREMSAVEFWLVALLAQRTFPMLADAEEEDAHANRADTGNRSRGSRHHWGGLALGAIAWGHRRVQTSCDLDRLAHAQAVPDGDGPAHPSGGPRPLGPARNPWLRLAVHQ